MQALSCGEICKERGPNLIVVADNSNPASGVQQGKEAEYWLAAEFGV